MTYPLEQVQRWMQTVLMHPGGVEAGMDSPAAREHIDLPPEAIEAVVGRSQALDSVERLEIYARAYYARLVECLEAEFPVLAKAVGEDLFREFAVGYLDSYPSRSYTLNQLGRHFADYLAETFPADEQAECIAAGGGAGNEENIADCAGPAFLIDLARLEWAFNEVFDGPGVEKNPPSAVELLSQLNAGELSGARLVPVPCLRLLELDYPVLAYYQALRADADATPPAPGKSYLAISRRDYVVRHYELTPVQHVLLGAILSGATIAEAIAAAAQSAAPQSSADQSSAAQPKQLADELHRWFRFWGGEGFFLAVA